MRRLCLGVTKDRVSVGVDDYRGVRTMSGQRHAESAGVGGKRRRFTIASERMKDDDRFALQALSLVGGADEYAGQIGQASCKRRAESWRWWATGLTMPRHWLRPTWASPSALARMSPTSASDITLVGSDLRSIVSAICTVASYGCHDQAEAVLGIRIQRGDYPGGHGRAVPVL